MRHNPEKIRRIAKSCTEAGDACRRQGEITMANYWYDRAERLLALAIGPVKDEELLAGDPQRPLGKPMRVGERADGPGGGVMTLGGFYTGD